MWGEVCEVEVWVESRRRGVGETLSSQRLAKAPRSIVSPRITVRATRATRALSGASGALALRSPGARSECSCGNLLNGIAPTLTPGKVACLQSSAAA